MKKTYKITFMAELTEDDVRAMKGCFYQAMNESMEIDDVWGLEIEEDDSDDELDNNSIEDLHKYTMHIDDIVDDLYNCENIDEVNDLLDSIPRKFGDWWVDIVMGLDGKAYYEVTNQWYENSELQVKTYDLEIEVEDEE